MAVYVDEAGFAGGMADHMGVPDFLIQRARGGGHVGVVLVVGRRRVQTLIGWRRSLV